ncbi:hypothetical protein J0X19_11835 [Hymenobacter sp. BT186]|uniref:Mobilization protein n=1 Tax=Hymenobacter telluris TaxID=2816474 RepID=A0A939EWE1_9BACT|nr:hypothetical protein [Hymenobacter telluris]MBO0358638.1 hypothetical protein [Hymenobacter telluris]MBW3374664.1 hypothetical protein [Hymenobacter norwichensis]
MARPRKKDDEKRTHIFHLALNKREEARHVRHARRLKVTRSEYLQDHINSPGSLKIELHQMLDEVSLAAQVIKDSDIDAFIREEAAFSLKRAAQRLLELLSHDRKI